MIDGKVCNTITSTSFAQRFFFGQATSKQFNNIDAIFLQREVNENNLCFGLSTLHARIRFFECCLHLSYKLAVNNWQTRSEEEMKMIENRKKIIQKEFHLLQLGLIVDQPKVVLGSSKWKSCSAFFENSTIYNREFI